MSGITRRDVAILVTIAFFAAILAAVLSQQGNATEYGGEIRPVDVRFDIAEDGTRFAFDAAPVFDDDGMPAAGNEFVTHGFIYPDGTLSGSDGVVVGDDGIGRPEFPDAVIGAWICYGTFINDGAHETDEPWVVTTQVYTFDDGSSFTSVGTERPPGAGPSTRAVTGGTGDYAMVSGELDQLVTGFNPSEGVVADFVATLYDVA